MDMNQATEMINSLVKEKDVVLFMKGTKDEPACGFSYAVVQILRDLDVEFVDVNVLEDDNLRQGIKDYTEWPTIPQLYVKGEFIGGCDIVRTMHQTGELSALLKKTGLEANSG